MLKVFGLTPDQYMITDRSSLRDFLEFEGLDDTPAIQRKIADVLGVDIRLLGSERIVDVVKVTANLHSAPPVSSPAWRASLLAGAGVPFHEVAGVAEPRGQVAPNHCHTTLRTPPAPSNLLCSASPCKCG